MGRYVRKGEYEKIPPEQLIAEIARVIPKVPYDRLTAEERKTIEGYLNDNEQEGVDVAKLWGDFLEKNKTLY